MKVIVLAGGSGTRLWPYSRPRLPKQFLHFGETHSLLQKTVLRFTPRVCFSDIVIVSQQQYFSLIKEQMKEIDPQGACQLLLEPEKKNTAPALALAAAYLLHTGCDPKECMLVVSSDHLLSPESRLLQALDKGLFWAQRGHSVLFGIRPSRPETGYGYIKADAKGHIVHFIEKPSLSLACEYVLSGDYFWNAGMFLFSIETWQSELSAHSPEIAHLSRRGFLDMHAHFAEMPDISIDCAVMEKSERAHLIALDVSWSDVGCWDSVYDVLEKDAEYNVKQGNVRAVETKNCLLFGTKRLMTTIGLENLFIVETEDALLIGKKGESQKVKQLYTECEDEKTSYRPWGSFTVLEEGDGYKVKRIVVEPLQKLSLQKHFHRSEHWVIIKGSAKVTLGEEERYVGEKESLFVPQGVVHRLENPGTMPLELIEVQVGEYVGEDDIVRLDDIYERQEL